MINLETSYLGLRLKNPVIVGSSGMTNSIENIIEAEKNGAAAVVLKSLFEEQINHTISNVISQNLPHNNYPEADDYISHYTRENDVSKYLELLRQCKLRVKIPVIASINCVSNSEWLSFAKKIQDAGADAMELNIFIMPSDPKKDGVENEAIYFQVIEQILKVVTIPVSVKISYYFSSLANFVVKLSRTGIKGIVLFNRFYSPDIDIENFEIKPAHIFSSPSDLSISLRWIAMLSPLVSCDLAASTGVHDGNAMIKQMLAGAKAVQVASVLYKKGFKEINIMQDQLEDWMLRKNFDSPSDFIGKMSIKDIQNPADFERVQFMKHFSGIE